MPHGVDTFPTRQGLRAGKNAPEGSWPVTSMFFQLSQALETPWIMVSGSRWRQWGGCLGMPQGVETGMILGGSGSPPPPCMWGLRAGVWHRVGEQRAVLGCQGLAGNVSCSVPASQDLESQQYEQGRVIRVGSPPKPAVHQPLCQMATEGACNTSFPLLDRESHSSGTGNRDGHRAGGRHDSLLAEQESSEPERAVERSWKCWINPCSQMLKLCNRNNSVQFVL